MGSNYSTPFINFAEPSEVDVAKASNKFTNNIYFHLAVSSSEGKNIVLSGLSISSVMAMLLLGAKGETAKEIQECLCFPEEEETLKLGFKKLLEQLRSNNSDGAKLQLATRVFVDSNSAILDDFADKISDSFAADAVSLQEDLDKAADSINKWMKEKTDGAINEIISAEDLKHVGIVLINALYIKADWKTKFNFWENRMESFYLTGDSKGPVVETKLMNLFDEKFRCKRIRSIGATALEMPYVNGKLSMIFILPDRKNGFNEMEKKLETLDLKEDFNFNEAPIRFQQITIPKIKLVGTFRLNEPLQALGVTKAFEQDKANFGGMSDTSKDLFVSIVRQKVFLEIDEEGTTAAAGDGCMVNKVGGYYSKEPPKLFICNRPFIFFLRENQTGVVLFIGRVLNPLVNG